MGRPNPARQTNGFDTKRPQSGELTAHGRKYNRRSLAPLQISGRFPAMFPASAEQVEVSPENWQHSTVKQTNAHPYVDSERIGRVTEWNLRFVQVASGCKKNLAWTRPDAASIPFLQKVGPLRDEEVDKRNRSFGVNS